MRIRISGVHLTVIFQGYFLGDFFSCPHWLLYFEYLLLGLLIFKCQTIFTSVKIYTGPVYIFQIFTSRSRSATQINAERCLEKKFNNLATLFFFVWHLKHIKTIPNILTSGQI